MQIPREEWPWMAVAIAAFLAAVFFRFWNLADAPLAVDEYFFGTSILNIAERGLPEFPCGGTYTRGVLVQYLSLPLLYLGFGLEFTTRFWPAVASLFSIVAVWCIARLAGGIKAAAIATLLVSLSVWETEFARFGRMYSPFQAIFLWYVYLQLLHLVNGRELARFGYLLLSALSIFVFAGSSFLLILNFLPLIWRGRRWTLGHIVTAAILLVFGTIYYSSDFRYFGVPPDDLPPATGADSGISLPINLPEIPDLYIPFALIGLVASAWLLRRAGQYLRADHFSIAYWAAAALALCFGLLGLGLGLVLAGMLLNLPLPTDSWNGLRRALGPLFLIPAAWLAGLTLLFWLGNEAVLPALKAALNYVFNYPDVYYSVVRPWLRAIPVTTVILALIAVGHASALLVGRRADRKVEPISAVLAGLVILLVILTALFRQPYSITRYTYFLYPIVLVVVTTAIDYWSTRFFERPSTRVIIFLAPVALLFVAAEDFRVSHLTRINSPEIRYRTSYGSQLATHYYPRWDFRSPSHYVNSRLTPDDLVVVFDQPLPHYLKRTSGIFIREGTENHALVWSCGGKRDLWSDAPLIDTEEEFFGLIRRSHGDVWLIVRTTAYRWRDPLEETISKRFGISEEFVSQDGHLAVYRLSEDAVGLPQRP